MNISDMLEQKKSGAPGVRKDLFGCIDILAVNGHKILGVQAVDATGFQRHLQKLTTLTVWPTLEKWLVADGVFEFHVWRKLKVKQGGKAIRWVPRVIPLRTSNVHESLNPDPEVAYFELDGVRCGSRFYPFEREST